LITDALSVLLNGLRQSDPAKADRVVTLIEASNRGEMGKQEARSAIAELFGLTRDAYAEAIRKGEARNQPLLDYIAAQRATYKTAVLSNVGRGGLAARFPNDELQQYFDAVVESGAIGYAKPDRQAYLTVADKLGLRPDECLLIDDCLEYCRGATAVSMPSVLYQSFDQMKQDVAAAVGQSIP
jgi:HAD superfamily hydrolase (TIGR01509 family)